MALLPRSALEFSDPGYWKGFFEKQRAPFEWYGSFEELGESLIKYLKYTDRIVQIGCGNSLLASQLHDNGYRNVLSIDSNADVIAQQIKNNEERTELSFACTSATDIGVTSETTNVVLDKGTLDALLPPDYTEEQCVEVVKMFEEVERILAPMGRYIVVSLAQSHILRVFVEHFARSGRFMIRVHKVSNVNGFFMPVFFLIATKTRIALPSLVLEFVRSLADKADRCLDTDALYFTVQAEQEYAWFVQRCQKKLTEEISLVMCDIEGKDRYKVTVVEDRDAPHTLSYSVFIVPPGRDNEWLFATEKGRRFLRAKCGVTRLAVVAMFRDQTYGDLDSVKKELDAFVWQFDSRCHVRTAGAMISYLTLEGDSPVQPVARGTTRVNGPWIVEEVVTDEKLYRRLTFLSSQNLLQTEVLLTKKKKGRKAVNLDILTSEYHETMLAALTFIPCFSKSKPSDLKLRLAVLGLGGGAFPSFLARSFPSCHVIAVEYDGEVVDIAKQHFGLVVGPKGVDVRVQDAINFINEIAANKNDTAELLDAVFVDVAGSMDSQGMCCPPSDFVSLDMLQAMFDSLSPSGVLALNIVTRDDEIAANVKKTVKTIFPNVFTNTTSESINEVIICPKGNMNLKQAKKVVNSFKDDIGLLHTIALNFENLRAFDSR